MDARPALTIYEEMELRDPILVCAFRGWNDAGDAASYAAIHLGRAWGARRIASIDPEEFYDFQAVRPQVELVDGKTRRITWPENEFWAARLDGDRDVIVLVGTEPNTRWRTFTDVVIELARSHGVRFAISLGALLADVPHSRSVHITATAANPALVDRLGLQRSRYEGPTGIVGVLSSAFTQAGIDAASLWAAVPHYLAVAPNPKAALALVERATELIGAPVDTDDLIDATRTYEERVTEMVASDEDVQNYVRMLEERSDERDEDIEHPIDAADLPSGDEMAAELQRYLREHGGPGR